MVRRGATSPASSRVPKAIAQRYGLAPGSEIEFEPSGSVILLRPSATVARLSTDEGLALFDAVTEWIAAQPVPSAPTDSERGWTRDELYDHALAR